MPRSQTLVTLTLGLLLSVGVSAKTLTGITPGTEAPRPLGRDLGGQSLSLEQFAGRYVLLSFWATWCAPCRKELPFLEGFQAKYGSDKLQVLAINVKESPQLIRRLFKKADHMTLKVGLDKTGSVADAYGAKGLPYAVLVGPDGKVVRSTVGYSDKSLMELLNEAYNLSMKL